MIWAAKEKEAGAVRQGSARIAAMEIACLAIVLLLGVLSYQGPLVLPAAARSAVAFLLVFWLPGMIFLRVIGYTNSVLSAKSFSMGFVVSIALLSLPSLVIMALGAFRPGAYVALVLNFSLLLTWLVKVRHSAPKLPVLFATYGSRSWKQNLIKPSSFPSPLDIGLWFCFLALLLLTMYFAMHSGYSGDNMTNLAISTRLVVSGQTDFAESILGTGFVEGRTMFHLATFLLALVSELGRVNPGAAILVYSSPLLALTAILAFYSLFKGLTSSRNATLFGTTLFMVYLLVRQDFPNGLFYHFGINDKTIGIFVFLPCIVLLAWEFLSLPRPRTLAVLCLGTFALSVFHPVVFLMCCFLVGSFVATHYLVSRDQKLLVPILMLAIPVLLGLPFPLFLRSQFQTTSAVELLPGSTNILVQHRLELQKDRLIVFPDGRYIGDPALILKKPTRIVAFLLLPLIVLIIWKRKDVMAQYLFAALLLPAILLFNPVTPPLLGKLVTPMMVFRFSWLFPDIMAIAFTASLLASAVFKYLPQERQNLSLLVASVLLVGGTALVVSRNLADAPTLSMMMEQQAQFPVLNRHGTGGVTNHLWNNGVHYSVVLAPDNVNEVIPGLAAMYVVERGKARTANFFPTQQVDAVIERIDAVEYFEQATVFDARLVDIITKYGVKYLVLVRTSPLVSQLNSLAAFELMYQDLDYSLFQITDRFHAALVAFPDAPFSEIVHYWSVDQQQRRTQSLLSCLAADAKQQDPAWVRTDVFYFPDRILPVLFAHPPSTVRCSTLPIPDNAVLEFSIALSPEVWAVGRGDGVQFDIYLQDGGRTHHLYSEYLDPANITSQRRWQQREVDLRDWAGQSVSITFGTDPGPDGDIRYDWAGWGEPRIVQPAYYSFVQRLPDAEASTLRPEHLRLDYMTVGEDARYVLFAHPPSTVTYRDVAIQPNSILYFGAGIASSAWDQAESDGVTFEVNIEGASGTVEQVYSRHIDPGNRRQDRHWFDEEVDLGGFAGQRVDIQLATHPGPSGNSDYDWAAWSDPVLVALPLAPSSSDAESP